jgi:hypothetical protein
MRDPSDEIRKWLYGVLNGQVTYNSVVVPVYSFPPKDAAMPYIQIAEQSSGPDEGTKDCYITRHTVTLEIYTSHTGNDASYVPVNTISNTALQLIRTRTKVTGLTGFNVVACVLDGTITDRFILDNKIVIIKVLNFTLTIAEE